MPTPAQSVPRAVRVTGVPPTVVMWVDHEAAEDTLCLNADLITEVEALHLDAALKNGSCTAGELIRALMPQKE